VVGPGCKHPSGSIYTVVVDAPIAEVSGELLRSIIQRFKTGKKVNTNYQRLEEGASKAKKLKYEVEDPLDSLQVLAIMPPAGEISRSGDELRGDHPIHGSTNGGNYVINTSKNVWHCKRCESGGGAAAAIAVKHGLISCSEAGPGELRGDLFKQVLKIAKEKYGMSGKSNGTSNSTSSDGPKAEEQAANGEISEEDLLKIKIPENPRFKTNLESDNFMQEFIRYGETVTDSYKDYWFAGGLSCLSVAVNRNVVIKLRQGAIYPNVWINILGLSSLARKSTAIDKTDLTIAAANIDPSCKMPDEFSPEAMIEMLDRRPRAYMIKDESAGLLAVMKKDYMRGLKDALMQLYDGKDINRELRTSRRKSDKTSFQVKNPYLNLVLATTPGSFAANTELLDVTSGWLPRFLHFFPNHVKDRWLPLEEGVPENDLLSAGCHARLIKIRIEFYDLAESRVMHLSDEAAAYFVAWQKVREGELVEAKDDRRAQFYSRLAVYALKMSMLFTVGRGDYADGMKISFDHMQEACRLVDDYFMPMALTIADLVGKAADKNLMDKIISVLTSRGGKLKRRELIRAVHAKKKDLDESLEALEESREIQLVTVSNRQGSPTQWITLSSDNENRAKCQSVTSVEAVILSHTKKSSKEVCKEDLVRPYDTCDTMPPCDKKPVDTDSSNATLFESVGEGDKPLSGPHPRKENPDLAKFKANVRSWSRNTCRLCEQHFEIPLAVAYHGGGYICERCRRDGAPTASPPKVDSQIQTELEGGEAKA